MGHGPSDPPPLVSSLFTQVKNPGDKVPADLWPIGYFGEAAVPILGSLARQYTTFDKYPDYKQLGFRVPCIAVSPWSPQTIVKSGPYEHYSILRMIEWRWGLAPMTLRDKTAKNLAEALDFSLRRPPAKLPKFTAPPALACPPGSLR